MAVGVRKYKYPYHPRKSRSKNAATSQRQKLWQAMRILRRFDANQLAATTESDRDCARKLICWLRQFGIVQALGRGQYQLMKNLGPHAPTLRADGTLYDHNSGLVLQRITKGEKTQND